MSRQKLERDEQDELILEATISHLSTGDPIPLSWAVEHATEFSHAWARSGHASLLLKIAAFAVPRPALVLAASAIAKKALPSAYDDRPEKAIDIAEAWARGEASADDVREACNDTADAVTDRGGISREVARAAGDAAFLALAVDSYDAADSAVSSAEAAVEAVWLSSTTARTRADRVAIWDGMANIVRAQLAHRDILADVVNANRSAL